MLATLPVPDNVRYAVRSSGPPKQMFDVKGSGVGKCSISVPSAEIRVMPPSPERTELYVKMRDMIIEDAPFAGSMARTRFYLVNPRLKNFKPEETFYNWVKYLDVAE